MICVIFKSQTNLIRFSPNDILLILMQISDQFLKLDLSVDLGFCIHDYNIALIECLEKHYIHQLLKTLYVQLS